MFQVRKIIRVLALVLAVPALAGAQSNPVKTVTDAHIAGNVTFHADTTYLLDGLVFVDSLETLTIEAGTVIKGKKTPTSGTPGSALVVARGGRIYANGAAIRPIIFTAEADDVTDPNDLPAGTSGEWGGVIILGRASINAAGGENNIEGIDATTESRGKYGGGASPDDNDNSGVFRYVSIRHGGIVIGAANEINGLTMGAVGLGTTIEFVEVFSNQDDGFEWFGGTVDTRYLVSSFNEDDAFDYDEGFRGRGQFWFSIQADDNGDFGGEHDGGTDPETGTPFATPQILNATYIGSGPNASNAGDNNAFVFRDNAGGKYRNSIFTEFKGLALDIEDLADSVSTIDSRVRFESGDLVFAHNMLHNFGAGATAAALGADSLEQALIADPGNMIRIVDPQLRGISRTNDGGLDPRPAPGGPAWIDSLLFDEPADSFFFDVDFAGAFGNVNWAADWSFISASNILTTAGGGTPNYRLAEAPSAIVEESVVNDAPKRFTLTQNFPNPFNPATNISFTIPATSRVRLVVYNILGQEVETLINGVRPAGTYTVVWDASRVSTGIYFYRLEALADGQQQTALTRKMTLLK